MESGKFNKLFLGLFIAALAGFIAVIFVFNPDKEIWWQHLTVYALMFAFVFCLATFLNFKLKIWRSRTGAKYASKKEALRQGLFMAVCVVGLVLMQAFGVFTWWTALILIAAIIVTELYFVSRR